MPANFINSILVTGEMLWSKWQTAKLTINLFRTEDSPPSVQTKWLRMSLGNWHFLLVSFHRSPSIIKNTPFLCALRSPALWQPLAQSESSSTLTPSWPPLPPASWWVRYSSLRLIPNKSTLFSPWKSILSSNSTSTVPLWPKEMEGSRIFGLEI